MEGRVWNQSEISQLGQVFASLDRDRSGKLDSRELTEFFQRAGINPQLVPMVLRIFDRDRTGTFSFDEFVAYTREMQNAQSKTLDTSTTCSSMPLITIVLDLLR
jgi:Ca2+-binding EF-hand superfamily protein